VAAGTHDRRERGERPLEPVPDEGRAEAEGDVVRLRLDREGGGVSLDDLHPLLEARGGDALPRRGGELGTALDADDAAPEPLREEHGRTRFAARHVEHA
jgi:hypothetical protein